MGSNLAVRPGAGLPYFVGHDAYLAMLRGGPRKSCAHFRNTCAPLGFDSRTRKSRNRPPSATNRPANEKPMKKITIPACAAAAMLLSAPQLRADAGENWTKNCAACHGPDGAGHTKAGRMAQVKDMTDAAYQKGFTDEQAAKQIKGGLTDKTGKERMKAFGDKFSDAEIKELVAYVRTLQK